MKKTHQKLIESDIISVVWLWKVRWRRRKRREGMWRRSWNTKDLRICHYVSPSSVSSQEIASKTQNQTEENERQRYHHHHTHLLCEEEWVISNTLLCSENRGRWVYIYNIYWRRFFLSGLESFRFCPFL